MIDSVHPRAHLPRHSRKARKAAAAGLLGLAFLSMVAFIAHIAKNQSPDSPLFGNNPLESTLGLVWITSGLLAMLLREKAAFSNSPVGPYLWRDLNGFCNPSVVRYCCQPVAVKTGPTRKAEAEAGPLPDSRVVPHLEDRRSLLPATSFTLFP